MLTRPGRALPPMVVLHQAPAAARQRGASVAMLLLVALLAAALSGADAALSVCAAVKPVW
jgi:hypothetical protein